MATDHFCLIWNNFQNSILSALGNLQTCQDLVDVTLMCEGQNVKAHKVILSACSPYFRNLFKEHPCQHPIIILKDVTHSDLTALLQFMYQGEVMVSQDNLASFLKTAELLQISGLTGSQQSSTNSDQNETTSKAPPDIKSGKPPDISEKRSAESVTDRLSSEVSFKKQKRNDRERLEVDNRENKSNYDTDPLQSCSYDSPSPVIIKTESLDKDYDEMESESGDISNPEQYDNNSSHLEEPSILERSLKAQSDFEYIEVPVQPENNEQMKKKRKHYRKRWEDAPNRLEGDLSEHVLEPIPCTGKKKLPTRQCVVCAAKKKRSESRYFCTNCNIVLHTGECYTAYHTLENY